MAKAQFTIGAGTAVYTSFASVITIRWSASLAENVVLPPVFFANQDEPASDRDLQLISFGNDQRISMQIGEEGPLASGDLSDAAEQSSRLITLEAPGWGPYTFVGPNNAQATSRDTTEPYIWGDSNYTVAELHTIATAYENLPANAKAQTTLLFDDGTEIDLSQITLNLGGLAEITATAVPALSISLLSTIFQLGGVAVEATVRKRVIEMFCLDPDFAHTTGTLKKGEAGIKVFLLIAEQLSLLQETLVDGLFAEPLLIDVPDIRIDDSLFRSSGDVTITLDNSSGRFTNRDYIGQFVQFWGLSFGEEKRLLFFGIIASQQASQLQVRLTITDIPTESLQRLVPGRTITQENFPNSTQAGTVIPAVFGRALRHRCPHVGNGLTTALIQNHEPGDVELSLQTVRSVAIGDVLRLSPGQVETEEVRVVAVDFEGPSVLISEGLRNSHLEDAVVTSADIIHDYLLGEGQSSVGAFQQIFRVYHNNRALPEHTCQEFPETQELFAGTHEFVLQDRLHVFFDNWYRGYIMDFIDADENTVLSVLIESYDAEANTVGLTTTSDVSYICYRLREYRFFDGSQDYPYPGYAALRFARNYTGEIRADVEGFAETSPSGVLRELLTNNEWGAGEQLPMEVENDLPGEFRLEGVLDTQTPVTSVVEEIAKLRKLKLVRERNNLLLSFRAEKDGIEMPALAESYIDLPTITLQSLHEREQAITVRYRRDGREKSLIQQINEQSGPDGTVRDISLPLIYDTQTANRVAYHESQRSLGARRVVEFSVDARDVGDLTVGDKVRLPKGLGIS